MRVGIDVRLTWRMSVGMKLYTTALRNNLPIVAPDIDFRMLDLPGNVNVVEQIKIPLAAVATDLMHYTTNFAGILTPKPFVVTIHDLHYLKFPGLFSPRRRRAYGLYERVIAARSAAIIVDDERTVGDCERYLGIKANHCRVVPLGYDPAILDVAARTTERPYFLYAGNHWAHKLVDNLVMAWSDLPTDVDVDLYLTGHEDEHLRAMASAKPSARTLYFTGDLSESELWSYFAGALSYVHPALAEGFGLPMLEAMAIGTPVIATEEAIPLALKSGAATYPARDVGALRELLADAARRPAHYHVRAREAEALARPLTWAHCALQTAEIYRDLL